MVFLEKFFLPRENDRVYPNLIGGIKGEEIILSLNC